MPSFKTPPHHFHVDVINIWFFARKIFKSNYLTYLSVALSFQERQSLCGILTQSLCGIVLIQTPFLIT